MADLGLSEPYDLEAWLASAPAGLFDRDILWIARQDRPSEDQRSDLVGIDRAGNLLITELKRGTLDEYAITQALAYAAEYKRKTAEELAQLFWTQSSRATSLGLLTKATSLEEAGLQLVGHVGTDTELNESQILVLAAEEFTPGALAICDYLNESSGEAAFSFECWRFSVFEESPGQNLFSLEQILPPQSARQAIDERREAAKAKRYARDPVRKAFVQAVYDFLNTKSPGLASGRRGASYGCWLNQAAWLPEKDVSFSVHEDNPRLTLPNGLIFASQPQSGTVEEGDGQTSVRFQQTTCATAQFDEAFGNQLWQAIEQITRKADAVATPPEVAEPATVAPVAGGTAAHE